MKKYLILGVVAVLALALCWAAFAQTEEGRKAREERREAMRKKFEQMSPEQREKFRAEMRERLGGRGFAIGRQEQLKAVKEIEEQVAKLKTAIEAAPEVGDREKFRELSDEERAKLREKMTKTFGERREAIRAIDEQLAKLRGPRPMGIGPEDVVQELTAIRELAIKEKAEETSGRLGKLIARYQLRMGPPEDRPVVPMPRPTGRPPVEKPVQPQPKPEE